MAAVISKLVEAAGDIELRQIFTMRQIHMGRVRPGAVVDPITGQLPVQHVTLAELFDQQREAFVQQLVQEMKAEHNENADPQTIVTNQGDGHGTGESGEDEAGANAPRIILAES